MSLQPYEQFESHFAKRIENECAKVADPSHDFLHVLRVVEWAKHLARLESADLNVVVPAAYLHDVVIVSKTDPRRNQASRLSADEAARFLAEIGYPADYHQKIHHAIAAHSFSANIPAETLEAKVVQDADRLDGIGAIGVARCFSMGGLFNRPFYHEDDVFAKERIPNDKVNTLDHFYVKLLKVPEMLQTSSGRQEGKKRADYLRGFLQQLESELLA